MVDGDGTQWTLVKPGQVCNRCFYKIQPDGSCSPDCDWARDTKPGSKPGHYFRPRLAFRIPFRVVKGELTLHRPD